MKLIPILMLTLGIALTSHAAEPLKGAWIGDGGRYLNWHLEFQKPGHVTLKFEHMDGVATMLALYDINADYTVGFRDFSSVQGDIEQSYVDDIRNTLSAGRCAVVSSDESLTNLRSLRCHNGDKVFWDTTRLVAAGLKRKVGELEVITMGVRKGKTTACTRLRAMPSAEAQLTEYLPEDQSGAKNCAPSGTALIILARTPSKLKVASATNYWYYVAIGHQQKAWVFGGLIKIQ